MGYYAGGGTIDIRPNSLLVERLQGAVSYTHLDVYKRQGTKTQRHKAFPPHCAFVLWCPVFTLDRD